MRTSSDCGVTFVLGLGFGLGQSPCVIEATTNQLMLIELRGTTDLSTADYCTRIASRTTIPLAPLGPAGQKPNIGPSPHRATPVPTN
ncbi:hypothetical protein FRC12_023713 [Ceratobasidium sp. 428]|nr:hypothetical protein FRC12_023713 [Ceratobasidium sp. 428]